MPNSMPSHLIPDFTSRLARDLANHALHRHKNALIEGPMGSGKTTLATEAARERGRPVEVIHLGACSDVEATLQGQTVLRDGQTRFVPSRFAEAIAKPETVIVVDEVNRAQDPKAQAVLMGVTDPSMPRLYIEQAPPGQRVIDVAPGVVFFLTANVGADFYGIEPLDIAFLDRLIRISVSYSDKEDERLVAMGIPRSKARHLVKIARAIRKQNASGAIVSSVSTRGLVNVVEMLLEGFALRDAFEAVVKPADDESRAALRAILRVSQ